MAPEPDDPAGVWNDALRAANLFAADPHGLGGIVLRAGAGPVRDLWLDHLRDRLTGPVRRMPPGIADDRLIGGLDLPATLRAGRPVIQRGLLAEADGGVVVVPMAERLERGTVARLAGALDTGMLVLERDGLAARLPARFGLVLLDEGQEDETVAEALADRLALRLDLSGVSLRDVRAAPSHTARGADAAAGPPAPDATATLCAVAEAFGIASLRAPLLALRIGRLIAGEAGRDEPNEADLIEAAHLVLAPRATRLPAPPQPAEPEPADPPPPEPQPPQDADRPPEDAAERADATPREADETVLDAVRAALPKDLLARFLAGGPPLRAGAAGRMGVASASPLAGRPVGSRPGDPRRGRLDLIATLRAAAPWQRLRRGEADPRRVCVTPEDFRIRRLKRRSETTTIFCVDASGSAALERLAEAKGAVELLLAEAYVRRDRIALVAFRGARAETVLPPTRSLVRAKRVLAGLPGGGGTPLAAGLDTAAALALGIRRAGGSPVIVLLTDGRANVARSGLGGRALAGEEALAAARVLRVQALPILVIDTGARPDGARGLAEAAQGRYCPLPHADAGSVSAAVRAATA
ncbi:magnesium chelatase subunit BchD [Methylorubrum extorquens]|uniref:Magnesium chelatase subunit BchD n=2 Tax=Methylorubrum extorquens TaxID=408 RepID=A0A2N9APS0_METEX|nr:magnesium chelatase subunit D [Methylorubrum zatmanii]ARO56660.1 magnesium chelatase ATPase subunit D [Methylorubrum zatmanii]KQQ14508.1 magnesium chelatase ATPase subunit D [Methylobacterium sp. Leaf121]SOR29354.1 magnesium chelatase subunit BchD [Methylorubrum extorquens]